MTDRSFPLDRRKLLAGLGAAVLGPFDPTPATAQGGPTLSLQANSAIAALHPGGPDTPIWLLADPAADAVPRFKRGDQLEVAFGSDLPVSAVLNWRGIDGVAAAEPLLSRAAVPPGAKDRFRLPLRHAGTLLCEVGLLGDGAARPARALPLVVRESEPIAVDRDEVLLIEDWRLRADGTAIAPGSDPRDTTTVYTANGRPSLDIPVRPNERLRLRFVSGLQRHVIAIKIENNDVRVMALDSQPSEPFLARNGALVLAPGTRVDAFIDATGTAGTTSAILLHDGKEARPIARLVTASEQPMRGAPLPPAPPLPSNGLPAQLDLKGAARFEMVLGGPQLDWATPAKFAASAPSAFRVKPGRTVVLALTNRAEIPTVFHLHGHHFRLLDRLDDGWKPFWLDTLAINPGQTQRIAFAAETAGRWLVESVATDWTAPRLLRWYGVE
jgi:FtsP/CotA-like multicopper oxidase with cupredoxin domain